MGNNNIGQFQDKLKYCFETFLELDVDVQQLLEQEYGNILLPMYKKIQIYADISRLKKDYDRLQNSLDSSKKRNEVLENQVKDISILNQKQQQEINSLHSEILEKDATIKAKESEIKAKESEIKAKEPEIKAKDSETKAKEPEKTVEVISETKLELQDNQTKVEQESIADNVADDVVDNNDNNEDTSNLNELEKQVKADFELLFDILRDKLQSFKATDYGKTIVNSFIAKWPKVFVKNSTWDDDSLEHDLASLIKLLESHGASSSAIEPQIQKVFETIKVLRQYLIDARNNNVIQDWRLVERNMEEAFPDITSVKEWYYYINENKNYHRGGAEGSSPKKVGPYLVFFQGIEVKYSGTEDYQVLVPLCVYTME